uniref:Uncharacterized protein n=1 Tax=Lepeophtheirus salmonis TaxID=72036 RepID=A0A0K2SZR5_LEPSM
MNKKKKNVWIWNVNIWGKVWPDFIILIINYF